MCFCLLYRLEIYWGWTTDDRCRGKYLDVCRDLFLINCFFLLWTIWQLMIVFVLVKCLYSYDCLCLFKSLYCTCIVSEFTLCMLYNKSLIECLINSQTPKYLFSWMISLLRCQWAMTPSPGKQSHPPPPETILNLCMQ